MVSPPFVIKFVVEVVKEIVEAETEESSVKPSCILPTVLNVEFTFDNLSGTDSLKLAHFKALSSETQKQLCVM
jgi:hypothetical protein